MSIDSNKMNHLQAAVKAVVKDDNARIKAGERVLAKTEAIVTSAIEIGSLTEWDIYRNELDRLARINVPTRKALGYEEIEVDRKGTMTLVIKPRQTLQNIFSVIRQSFALSVPLKDGRGEPRPFNAIKAEKVTFAAKAKKAKASDRDKDVEAIAEMFKACMTNIKNIEEDADVHALRARIKAEVVPMFPTAKAAA